MKINNKNIIISLIFNILIILFTIFASMVMFTDWNFTGGNEILEASKIGMFKFFTVDSNIFMGVIALIFAVNEILLLLNKKAQISTVLYVFKLIATVGVALTFFTVFGYLGFIVEGGVIALLQNSNLFFHLIIPILSMVTFIFFEKTDKIKFSYTFIGTLTAVFYSIFYLLNILFHVENGRVSPEYDWYWFIQGGVWQAVIILPLMLLITYGISYLLWVLNRMKINKNKI